MDSNENKYQHLVGQVIDDRYEILKVKGIGGMAVVLKARDTLKNRTVAIKMLNEKHSNDNASIRRFVNESRAIAMLSSEHIVDIYDVAFTGKRKYIVMEYIEGITLREYMHRNSPLGLEKSLDFIMQILSALQHAHEKGVVHRDIKPQNIMVQKNGKLKVTDFGIAQISDLEKGSSGVAMGTVYYISPEQASGKTTTFSSDIYSAGIMLYEMVTGKLPFEGDTPLSIAMMQVNTAPLRPRKIDPKIPQGLEQIILRAINKAPQDRFRSAKSMLRALEIIKRDKSVIFEETQPKKSLTSSSDQQKAPQTERKLTKPSPRTLFPIILGVTSAFLFVLLIAGIVLISSLLKMTSEDNSFVVKIPHLVSQSLTEELKASLLEQNIVVEFEEVNNDIYEAGKIVSQDPQGGQTRKLSSKKENVTVSLQISKGKKSFTLSDYKNQEYRKALLELENLGAVVTVEEKNDSSMIAGYIISTSPEKGAVIKSGDTVTLYVSKGMETSYAPMIDVVGMESGEAKRKLFNANFLVGTITYDYSDTVPFGNIVSQGIEPGTSTAQKHTEVDLVISLGPKEIIPDPTTQPESEGETPNASSTETPTTSGTQTPTTSSTVTPTTSGAKKPNE
ncbi:MAG: Stk1 family PASTA domain-containing Ser/Thr kinase [Clostridia bacterium]|nr:Stk1 family PASTA domain-containing Ser/Thr kinase [Clostridia bacterium]